jgi:hypothetical protein
LQFRLASHANAAQPFPNPTSHMKTFFSILAVVFFVVALPAQAETPKAPPAKEGAAEGVKYEGGDGSSVEKAIVIKGAKNSEVGIKSEYAWLAKNHPGYKMRQQSLKAKDGKRYDVLEITTKEGKDVEVYFDITEFFGKF